MIKNVIRFLTRAIGEVRRILTPTGAVPVVPDKKAAQVRHVAAHFIDRRDIDLEFDERYREIRQRETHEKFERGGERGSTCENSWK
jgi:hypothetical protein